MRSLRTMIAFLIVSVVCSCIEESSETATIIENLSGQQITITPYDNGVALASEAHSINPLEKKNIQRSNARGKDNTFFYSDDIQITDSVVVDFSRGVKATHYSYSVSGNNSKAIKRDSPRSLFNRDSYKRVILSETKYSSANEFIYTFTIQDYIDATK